MHKNPGAIVIGLKKQGLDLNGAMEKAVERPGASVLAVQWKNPADDASSVTAAIMCSEGLWRRCHRRILSDQMLLRGFRVEHIPLTGELSRHKLAAFVSVVDGRVIYDASPANDPSKQRGVVGLWRFPHP